VKWVPGVLLSNDRHAWNVQIKLNVEPLSHNDSTIKSTLLVRPTVRPHRVCLMGICTHVHARHGEEDYSDIYAGRMTTDSWQNVAFKFMDGQNKRLEQGRTRRVMKRRRRWSVPGRHRRTEQDGAVSGDRLSCEHGLMDVWMVNGWMEE